MSGYLTLDTSVLVAAERGDRVAWTTLRKFVAHDWIPLVPTVVLAESWRGARQARLSKALRQCRIEALDEATARRAGELSARSGLDDPVDAIVVITASQRGGQLWTHDPHLLTLVQYLPPDARPVVIRSSRG